MGSSENKFQPKIIGSKLGSPLGSGLRSGLGSGSARARLGALDLLGLFGLGSARGSARDWLRSELNLGLNFSRICLIQAG